MGITNIDILEFVTWGGEIDTTAPENFIKKDLHIKLESDLTITGSAVFINCIISMNNHSIYSKDTLIMKNCSVSADRCLIENDGVTGIFAPDGYIQNCSLSGFTDNSEICVKELDHTDCFKCHKIICGDENGTGSIKHCTFTKCDEIELYHGCVHECEFKKLVQLKLHESFLRLCAFEGSVCTKTPLITAENKSVSSCIFKDIVLLDSAYLAELQGDVKVDLCGFANIRTSRKDKKLFANEKELNNGYEKYITNCHGMEDVKNLDGE